MLAKKKLKKLVCFGLSAALFSFGAVNDADIVEASSYQTVTEVYDWGPSVSKVVINLDRHVTAEEVAGMNFNAHVKRILAEGAITPAEAMAQAGKDDPVLGTQSKSNKDIEGDRTIIRAYASNAYGDELSEGDYVTLEFSVAPQDNLGSALNFDLHTMLNDWVYPKYTITVSGAENQVVTDNQGNIRPQADRFNYNHKIIGRLSFPYASYEPTDGQTHPLIIWLHGMGEGGNSPSLPIMGNKAVALAEEGVQKYFGGAYVLAPQARTYWMHGHKDFGDGSSVYSEALMEFIKAYVAEHPQIDTNRIYVGGDSNGGYMTMLLVRDNPGYFAAAFPCCESLADKLISNKDIKNIAKTPIWFTAAKTDTVVPPNDYAVPTVARLQKAGADVHFSYFDNVTDQTGLYKKADGTPYEYMGHWSWIHLYNDLCEDTINGKTVKLFDWLSQQHK